MEIASKPGKPLKHTNLNMKTQKIGKFTITMRWTGCDYSVIICPGTLFSLGARNKSTEYTGLDFDIANHQFEQFVKYAQNQTVAQFWDKLNRAPNDLYLRFQRFVARRNDGKWIMGINIYAGEVTFNLW